MIEFLIDTIRTLFINAIGFIIIFVLKRLVKKIISLSSLESYKLFFYIEMAMSFLCVPLGLFYSKFFSFVSGLSLGIACIFFELVYDRAKDDAR